MIEFWNRCYGKQVDGYQIEELIDFDEVSALFRAGHKTRRAVVRLSLPGQESLEAQLTRWQRTRRLSHPALLPVLAAGLLHMDDATLCYAVMERADDSLSALLRERPLSTVEAREALGDAVSALCYLRAKDLTYRFLKPSCFLVKDNRLMLSPEHLYRTSEASEVESADTPYAAPEAKLGFFTEAADVWSLGVCIVEALTQRLPVLAGEEPEIVFPPDLPAPFQEIVQGCLRSDVQSRWTMAQVAAILPAPPREARKLNWKPKKVVVRVPRFSFRPGKLMAALCILLIAGIVFASQWQRVQARYLAAVDQRIRQGPFSSSSNLYAAPEHIAAGDSLTPQALEAELKRSGYSSQPGSSVGWYRKTSTGIEINPGSGSVLQQDPVQVEFRGNSISKIVSSRGGSLNQEYYIEPELITNELNRGREKRRLVSFNEIPPSLVRAVLSVEDKHFFQHMGFDPLRILRAAYQNWREGRKGQGASTLTMQLARNLWLEPEKTWKRKAQELMISLRLEQKLTKEQIFEYYCNQVYLGRHDTFNIHGFGEAARVYFNKELAQLTTPEAAMLAGLVQRPSYYNPFRYPDRMKERRDLVLMLMRQNGYLTQAQYQSAINTPVTIAQEVPQDEDAPYFLALANQEINQLAEQKGSGSVFRVDMTLDRKLQKAAEEAVQIGMAQVDKRLKGRKWEPGQQPAQAQAALVALDPHTGEIKALVGGRQYTSSQLNHAISLRQPGSVFKPFVYAAAISGGVDSANQPITPYTVVSDLPTTFWFDGKPYQPGNFHDSYHGAVTLRDALAHSMNIPAVKVAEMVGYDEVVALAQDAGMNHAIQPTPAVALGAYEATPLEIAGAYTIFANGGTYVKPTFIARAMDTRGEISYEHQPQTHRVLDAQSSYVMLDMLQEVVRRGTASAVNGSIKAHVAAKTGTSRDGWFAGFTPNLLCVVWVGFDDNRELGLEGAKSALPIWVEFMKHALQQKQFQGEFRAPAPEHKRNPMLAYTSSSGVGIVKKAFATSEGEE